MPDITDNPDEISPDALAIAKELMGVVCDMADLKPFLEHPQFVFAARVRVERASKVALRLMPELKRLEAEVEPKPCSPERDQAMTEAYISSKSDQIDELKAELDAVYQRCDRRTAELATEGRLREETAYRMAILLRRAETAESERDAALTAMDDTCNRAAELTRKLHRLQELCKDIIT